MRMRISILAAVAIAAISSLVIATSGNESTARPKQQDFVIAGSDGYGTQECLARRSDCGRIVADAWCEAKGFRSASTYRQLGRDEITGSAGTNGGKPVESFLISCKN
jgi:hypothetical protein